MYVYLFVGIYVAVYMMNKYIFSEYPLAEIMNDRLVDILISIVLLLCVFFVFVVGWPIFLLGICLRAGKNE